MEGALGTTSLTSQWALNKEDRRLCRTGMLRCNPRDLRLDCPLGPILCVGEGHQLTIQAPLSLEHF